MRRIGQRGAHRLRALVRDHVAAAGQEFPCQRGRVGDEAESEHVHVRQALGGAPVEGVAHGGDVVAAHPCADDKRSPAQGLPRRYLCVEQLGGGEVSPGVAGQRMPKVEIVGAIQKSGDTAPDDCVPVHGAVIGGALDDVLVGRGGGVGGQFEGEHRIVGGEQCAVGPEEVEAKGKGDNHALHQDGRAVKDHALPVGVLNHHAGGQFDHLSVGGEHAVAGLDGNRFHGSGAVGQAGEAGENDRLVSVGAAV